eukprot:TRINITY_DN8990_c0_g1_i1.p1 TRINITY_DN8990_c0_g1~~TRINITY_DN8990_c0_g1_i1.p1  ORF type:complete len:159 (+),score=20.23 TRINITY_DN8990_c0_g1_i1:113-589(+)
MAWVNLIESSGFLADIDTTIQLVANKHRLDGTAPLNVYQLLVQSVDPREGDADIGQLLQSLKDRVSAAFVPQEESCALPGEFGQLIVFLNVALGFDGRVEVPVYALDYSPNPALLGSIQLTTCTHSQALKRTQASAATCGACCILLRVQNIQFEGVLS